MSAAAGGGGGEGAAPPAGARATSLRNARVLITRAAEDRGPLEALLAERGAVAVPFPCIALADPAPEDEAPLLEALRTLAPGSALRPHAVALSSPNAARRFLARLAQLGLDPGEALRGVVVGAAGAGTASALAERGVRAAVVPEREVGAEALAAALAPYVGGRRVLLPRAAEGNPALEASLCRAGAEVRAAVLYRTVPAAAPDAAGLAALHAGSIDAILFASGSAARGFAGLVGAAAPALAARAVVACMGERCSAAAREAGLRVDAVADGGFPALVEALARALEAARAGAR